MKTIKDFFIEKIYSKYSVTENLARLLYDRWHIEKKCFHEDDVEDLLNSAVVNKVFYITPDINIVKQYSKDELKNLGLELTVVVDINKRIYRDNKYNFTWQDQYHGVSEDYTGLYQVIEPKPMDSDLCKF